MEAIISNTSVQSLIWITSPSAILGQVIAAARNTKQLSQSDLAVALNKRQSAISRIESGESELTVLNLQTIATVLDTTASKILNAFNAAMSMATNHGVVVTTEDLQVAIAKYPVGQAVPLGGRLLIGFLGQSIWLVRD